MKIQHLLPLALAMLCLTSTAWADSGVTRTLTASPTVPAGASVSVENLVGHMTVSQGTRFQVTATVIAGGDQAQALAQSVKLDVTSSGRQITVHVHYPVNQYDSYRFHASYINNNVCVLGGIVCFHGHSNTDFDYQNERVRVYQDGEQGVPLYVNVAVQLPAGMHASLFNGAGLLQAAKLVNPLALDTGGGEINASDLAGKLTANTRGGDFKGTRLMGDLQLETGGGDFTGTQLTGDLQLETGGGDADVTGAGGTLQAASGGGDIHLSGDLSGLSQLDVHTGGGELRLSGNLVKLHALNIGIGGGDAVLKVSNLSMHLNITSGGGDINVHLPDAANVVASDNGFSGDIGKAAGQGTISAGGGDVTISNQ